MKRIMWLLGIAAALFLHAVPPDGQLPTRTGLYSCSMIGNAILREGPGPIHHKTRTITSPDRSTSAFADIEARYDAPAPGEAPCLVTSRLLVTDKTGKLRELKSDSALTWNAAGVAIVGYSPDGSKIAADFFRAQGDYTTAPRPVVADLKTGAVSFRDLEDRITKLLPGCDYQQDITRVTNSGDVVVSIPANRFSETEGDGCPAQGLWLFNVATGDARRLPLKPTAR